MMHERGRRKRGGRGGFMISTRMEYEGRGAGLG